MTDPHPGSLVPGSVYLGSPRGHISVEDVEPGNSKTEVGDRRISTDPETFPASIQLRTCASV